MSLQATFTNDDPFGLIARIQTKHASLGALIKQTPPKKCDETEWTAIDCGFGTIKLEELAGCVLSDFISVQFYDEHVTEFFYTHYHNGCLSRSMALRLENISEKIYKSRLFGTPEKWETDNSRLNPYDSFRQVIAHFNLPISLERQSINESTRVIEINSAHLSSLWQSIKSHFR